MLAEVGEVDLFTVTTDTRPEDQLAAPADVALGRHMILRTAGAPGGLARLMAWSRDDRPRELARAGREWAGAEAELRNWAHPPYDLIWYEHTLALHAVGNTLAALAPDAAIVVDLDNLNDRLMRYRRRVPPLGSSATGLVGTLPRWAASRVLDLVDERRWRRWQHEVASAATIVTVCSDLDRRWLGVLNCRVVPNCYEPAGPVERVRSFDVERPVFCFVGLLDYAPNADAATWLARKVFPLVRARHPGSELHLVGRYGPVVEKLAGAEGVKLCGRVADMGEVLRRVDVVVVPLRYGGGTRLKVLEGFAWKVPVVSTTIGCEGLEVTDGQQLLIGDTKHDLADACSRIVSDSGLREGLVGRAYRHYEDRFGGELVRGEICRVAREAISSRLRGERS
ncbi:MAG: hypothetical protein JJLCMIEE_00843 [Acidimicrobiales bacterium]|nr:hypothetical protein [Acidimicrobiales bacterium]